MLANLSKLLIDVNYFFRTSALKTFSQIVVILMILTLFLIFWASIYGSVSMILFFIDYNKFQKNLDLENGSFIHFFFLVSSCLISIFMCSVFFIPKKIMKKLTINYAFEPLDKKIKNITVKRIEEIESDYLKKRLKYKNQPNKLSLL